MKVVIVGAGEIGFSIAALLSTENHDVVLVDSSPAILEQATQELDVATRLGSGTDWELLEELRELNPDLLIALTQNDETNLVCCSIAKALDYPQTIARVRRTTYHTQTRLDFGRVFSVDHFVSPELFAAQDICEEVLSLGSIRTESFAMGTVQMRTVIVPPKWRPGKPLKDLKLPDGVMAGLIARPPHGRGGHQMIFPHGEDSFQVGDEVTLIGQTEPMEEIHHFFGIAEPHVDSALIVGGGLVGYHTAWMLSQRKVRVRIIDKDRDTCTHLARELPDVTVIHHDGADLEFLKQENVDKTDVVIACTGSDEVNVLTSLLAREAGCDQVIAVVGETKAASMLQELGISHTISPRTSAANRILSIARGRKVTATAALYDNRAKILELKVSMRSKIVGIPISVLGPHLPKDFLISVIQNRGRTMIAHGQRILCPGDTAIVIASPKHVDEILELF